MATLYYMLGIAGLIFLILKTKRFEKLRLGIRYNVNYNWAALCSTFEDNLERSRNKIDVYPNKNGEIAIVTGGARGLGLDVVRNLLKCHMHVIIAARNLEPANKVAETLRNENLPGSVECMQLDLSSLKSVEKFSKDFKAKYQRLEVLVNNAGIIFGDFKLTVDSFESQLVTNYLSHLYLTHLLMPCLIAAGKPDKVARVVNVSSCAHYGIHMFFDDFNMEKTYHPVAGYARSKMAQILSTRYLNKMFEDRNLPVRMYAAHPGIVATDMFYNTPETKNMWFLGKFFKTPAEGAITVAYCAISPDLENRGGTFISNCSEGYTDSYSKNKENQERLYHMTRKMLDIKEFGKVSNEMT